MISTFTVPLQSNLLQYLQYKFNIDFDTQTSKILNMKFAKEVFTKLIFSSLSLSKNVEEF